jgi:hypothetical protein
MPEEKLTIAEKKEKLRQMRQEVFDINTSLADLNARILKTTKTLIDLDQTVVEELDEI